MSHKPLWAPWRMEFIQEDGKTKKDGCIFCGLCGEKEDRRNLILHRAKESFVILNKYPYNNGHLMVVPNTHQADLSNLAVTTWNEMNAFAKHCIEALKEVYRPEGFNLGMNLGTAAGAGIKDHLHLHIVPRWVGDTNFMPVLADTKSMPQHLDVCYEQLHSYFRRL